MSSPTKPKVVVIGGGTGLPVLLRGLKKYPLEITAIVTVADDGGSSGILRNELAIPPPGDICNVLVALSEAEPLFERLLQYRFTDGNGLSGHSLGNLLLAALISIKEDFVSGIKELSRVLNVKGNVLPAANQSIVLNAEMEDGSIVVGESKIPKANQKIKKVFLTPDDVAPLPESLKAIDRANLIVIGPGSLYTSILPNLLVPGISEALLKTEAKKVYICNVMTQWGETIHFTASDHVKVLLDHIHHAFINTLIVNNQTIPARIAARYLKEGAEIVHFDSDRLSSFGFEVISDKIIQYDQSVIRHDEKRVARILYSLLTSNVGLEK